MWISVCPLKDQEYAQLSAGAEAITDSVSECLYRKISPLLVIV